MDFNNLQHTMLIMLIGELVLGLQEEPFPGNLPFRAAVIASWCHALGLAPRLVWAPYVHGIHGCFIGFCRVIIWYHLVNWV